MTRIVDDAIFQWDPVSFAVSSYAISEKTAYETPPAHTSCFLPAHVRLSPLKQRPSIRTLEKLITIGLLGVVSSPSAV